MSPAGLAFWAFLLSALVLLAGACGGAYGKAIERGDKYAAAGQLDKAAAEYERAMKLDPDEPEAAIKLEQIRRRQAGKQLQRARALEARGEYATALAAVQQAVQATPDDAEAQREFTRLTKVVLGRANDLMAEGKLRAAFDLTTLVLKGSPRHPRARRMDKKVRTELAAQAYERAQEYADNEQLGNALVELAIALDYQPKFREAKLAFGRIKQTLARDVTFVVRLAEFTGADKNTYLTRVLTPTTLQQSLDDRLPVRVVESNAAAKAKNGVSVSGQFVGYAFNHTQRREQRSCDYVCGSDTRTNPERGRAERSLSQAEQSLARADSNVSRAEKTVLEREREVARLQSKVDREQQQVAQAQQRFDRCMSRAKPEDKRPCSSERSRLESEQRDLERARSSMRFPRDRLESARRDLGNRRSSRERERQDVARRRQQLRNIPTTIDVPRHCPFNYSVAIHEVLSRATMYMSIFRLSDDSRVLFNKRFRYSARRQDQTFPAQRGRCRKLASGDPLQLPSEGQLRKELIKQVVRDVRAKIMASYDTYRQRHLTVARKHESAGMTEAAVEAYVRYIFTGPHDLKGAKAIGKFLEKARGISKLDSLWKL